MRTRLYLKPKNIMEGFKSFYFNFPKILVITILWLVCSLPLITIGASFIAMSALFMKLPEEGIRIRRFFTVFKKKIVAGIPFSFVFCLVIIVFSLDYNENIFNLFVIAAGLFLLVMTLYYPIAAAGRDKISDTLKVSLLYPVTHIGDTVLIFSILVIFLTACLFLSEFLIILVYPLLYLIISRIVYFNNLEADIKNNELAGSETAAENSFVET